MPIQKMKIDPVYIVYQNWEHTCSDNCCYSYGTDVWVNGVKLENDGDDKWQLVESILTALGHKVLINEKEM